MKLNTLGYFFNSKLRDDEDINIICYLYGTANRLKTCFYKCSTKIKKCIISHILLVYVCMPIMG